VTTISKRASEVGRAEQLFAVARNPRIPKVVAAHARAALLEVPN
jgi:hypothetical protein